MTQPENRRKPDLYHTDIAVVGAGRVCLSVLV